MTAAYIRTSTTRQHGRAQRHVVANYCRQRRWGKLRWYQDKMSRETTNRPALAELLTDARAGKIERVVVERLDRVGGNLAHLAAVLDELRKLKIPLIAIADGLDSSNTGPTAELQEGFFGVLARYSRAVIAERVKHGMAAARERGTRLGRPKVRVDPAALRECRAKKMTITEMAERLGVSRSTVFRMCK